MKKILLLSIASLFSAIVMADHVMYTNEGNSKIREDKCEDIDSIKLYKGEVDVHKAEKKYVYNSNAINLTFEAIQSIADTVRITYNQGSAPTIQNPFNETILITTKGEEVFVNCASQIKDVIYILSGSSNAGAFIIETPRKFTVILDNLNLTSQSENAPIRSYSGATMNILLRGKSVIADSEIDTCNATIRSKGQIEFDVASTGSLFVYANSKRGIQTGDYLQIESGNISVISATGSDGVKANDYFRMKGGSLTIQNAGIEVSEGYAWISKGDIYISNSHSDAKLIKVDRDTTKDFDNNGTFQMTGGTIALEIGGDGSKGIKADNDVIISGGEITAEVNSSVLVDPIDNSYGACIKSGRNLQVKGGTISIFIAPEALGARGLTADSTISFSNNAKVTIDVFCEPYITENKGKTKEGYGLKSDGSIIFDACDVSIVSAAKSTSACCVFPGSGANLSLNQGAKVYLNSSSNATIGNSECPYINLNGGLCVAYAGNNYSVLSPSTKVSANGGTFIGLGKQNPLLDDKNSTLGCVGRAGYTLGTSINIYNEEENSIFKFVGDPSVTTYTSAYLFIATPEFINGASFGYSLGGTISDDTDFHGYYAGGSYIGGESGQPFAIKAGKISALK